VTLANISSAFKKTGIFPFYLNVYTDDDFMIGEVIKSNAGE
jgi:hypothetical protein